MCSIWTLTTSPGRPSMVNFPLSTTRDSIHDCASQTLANVIWNSSRMMPNRRWPHQDAISGCSNLMANYSMRGIKEKIPKRQEVEARQCVWWTVFPARSAGGSARALPAWWPTTTSIDIRRLSARITKAMWWYCHYTNNELLLHIHVKCHCNKWYITAKSYDISWYQHWLKSHSTFYYVHI